LFCNSRAPSERYIGKFVTILAVDDSST
jgi:hypothetical protein